MMRRDASPDASWRGAVAALVEDAAAFRRAVSFEQTANGNVGRALVLEEVVEPRIEKLGPKLVCCYLISALTPLDRFHHLPHIPPSNAPDHLCCVAGWDVRGAEGPDVYPPPYHRTWPG